MSAPTESTIAVEQVDEGFRVYIGNLPYSATEEQIRELIKPTGTQPTSVSLPMKFKRPAGFAFAGYTEESDAKKVMEQLNGHEMGDRKLVVEIARSKEEAAERRKAVQEKRAAGRAARAAEKKAQGENAATDGEGAVSGAETKPASRAKKARGPRRRVPEEGEDAEETAPAADSEAPKAPKKRNRKPKGAAAAAANGGDKAAQEGRIDATEEAGQSAPAGGKKEKRERKPRGPKLVQTGEESKTSIFVANLPFSVDDEALASIFTNLSIAVKSASVVLGSRRSRPGARSFRASRGYGFVEVADPAQQAEAVQKVDGSLIGDRQISARVAHEMKPAEKEAIAEAQQQETAADATA